MAKDLRISLLLDFYGEMLTEKQREDIELYYNEDLSLGEIASFSGISRQGVRDNIKRAEGILLDLEERLGLAKRFQEFRDTVEAIIATAKDIQFDLEPYNERTISRKAEKIVQLAETLTL